MLEDPNLVRNVLTPEALSMLQQIAEAGSFAGAARLLGMVPSALTYRVRRLEQALDVLLFDRSSHRAQPTEAGEALLLESQRLLADMDAVADRVRHVATGWEPSLAIAVDAIIDRATMVELCELFLASDPPTRLKLSYEALSGTLESLITGHVDLAIGVVADVSNLSGLRVRALGRPGFVFVVAPHHPLAMELDPLSDDAIVRHRAVAVADSARHGSSMTIDVMTGQNTFTVPDMPTMRDALLRGLGAGYLPEALARPHLATGHLVAKRVERAERQHVAHYVWRKRTAGTGSKALKWWLDQLDNPYTRRALLGSH